MWADKLQTLIKKNFKWKIQRPLLYLNRGSFCLLYSWNLSTAVSLRRVSKIKQSRYLLFKKFPEFLLGNIAKILVYFYEISFVKHRCYLLLQFIHDTVVAFTTDVKRWLWVVCQRLDKVTEHLKAVITPSFGSLMLLWWCLPQINTIFRIWSVTDQM